MRTRLRFLSLITVVAVVASACGAAATTAPTTVAPTQGAPASAAAAASVGPQFTVAPASAAPSQLPATDATVYPREQTLYTSGKQWGAPPTWNPMDPNSAMGVVGLQYETLFLYDPIKDVYNPWLASGGDWDSAKTTYTIHVRQGVTWSDGSPLTAADVAFTVNLYKNPALGSNLWTFVSDATASGNDVVVKFKANPAYQEWAQWLYNTPIVPAAIWTPLNNENILKNLNMNGVGTGPYTFKTAAQDRMVWVKNPNWWAIKALNLNVQPTYIVDIVNSSNNVALGQLLAGGLDLDNNYPARHRSDRQWRVQHHHVLLRPALHDVGQHRLARSEQQEEAPRRPGLPQGPG